VTTGLLYIDGSQGEGGGQILRSALALSMALGRPFRISKIRANRPKPGLMRQHLTAVEAAAAICSAKVDGARPGSGELEFAPGPVGGGSHRLKIGTAGSTTLVLQAILPALLFAPEPSEIVVEGGTHARWAPPFEFLERALVPLLNRLGPTVTVTLERHGFYPAGGGCLRVSVLPAAAPRPLRLEERGAITSRRASILLSGLHFEIAQREINRIRERLGWEVDPSTVVQPPRTPSPGNTVTLELGCEHVTEVCSAIGEQGKLAEVVADEAIDLAREYLAADVPVGRYLADQLMVPLAIAAARGAGECSFRTLPLSRHAQTNTRVVGTFVGAVARVEGADGAVRWSVVPASS
jgi:RNA 3'-terminal phosphate cyclase (ATP)